MSFLAEVIGVFLFGFFIARKTKTIKKLTKTTPNVGRETVCTANLNPKKGYRAARLCKKQRIKGCANGVYEYNKMKAK